ncbi:MAG: asparagine synthase (glutamine-hydrolyzing) [Blastocatellia bacterium]
MCGIVGLVDTIKGRVPPALLACMREVMIARGPDGDGHYIDGAVAMGMRRLSIIDLDGGWQPFFSRDGDVVAFQNGEIYNHLELRHQLEGRGHRFKSHSDTEVLAHGYTEWGIAGLLERLDGMFAIAILDRSRRELHLARDRFGEKPLFYAHSKGRFAYASNLLALAALDWVDQAIDAPSLDRYLALHYVPGDATLFKAIKRVLPGERLTVSIDDPLPQRHRYYAAALGHGEAMTDDDLAAMIEQAVTSRLIADVPVGVFLSGGLDSSIIAAIAAKHQPHIATFSMGFGSAAHDESAHAGIVARMVGSRHHHFQFDESSFRRLLPQVAAALDEPVGDQAQLPLYWLCQEARRHVAVALAGEGADEIFAGYSYYADRADEWRKGMMAQAATAPQNHRQRLMDGLESITPSGFPLLTSAAERERLTGAGGATADAWEAALFDWLDGASDGLQRAAAADIATWLPDNLLVKFDRMAMAHSLEGRAPFLSASVVEAGLRLSPSEKQRGQISKVALRRIAHRWLPASIVERRKQGFVLPMQRWLGEWLGSASSVQDYFLARPVPGLDGREAARLARFDLAAGGQRERLLFALVLLVEWYQSFAGRRQRLARRYREALVERDQPAMAAN